MNSKSFLFVLVLFIVCTGQSVSSAPNITLLDYYGLDSDGTRVDNFNTSNLEEIEKMVLNYAIESSIFDAWYLNFTADGPNGCSLGNKQNDNCYNYSNAAPYKWIQFINNTDTPTFDGTTGNQGDSITFTQETSGDTTYVNITIDEHYNPNVFKWYNAVFNFSDVKWQTGADQRITKNNMIKVDVDMDLVPIDADQYKLDFRVNYTRGTLEPANQIRAYACNANYVSGDPELSADCVVVAAKYPSELQDDGTKFRAIFTKELVDSIGNISSIVLVSEDVNPSRYYFIKTYAATAGGYTTHWNYSSDSGDTWANFADGYETELNINWFYEGPSPTAFVYNFYANDTNDNSNTSIGNITWDIDPSYNYPPFVFLHNPEPDESIILPYTANFTTSDPNDDELNVNLVLNYRNGTLYQTLITGMNQTNTSYEIAGITEGEYQLILLANETGTADLFSESSIRNITILDSTPPYSISGYVFDMNSTALSEVTVSDNQSINSTTTNVSGYYVMGGYVNGSYSIEASLYGYVSNSTIATVAGVDLSDQNITLIKKVSIGMSNMPYQIYIMLIIINILAIYYSFVNTDISYYTDIITSLFACIISFVIAHNSVIGIYIIYALQTSVQYDTYSSLPLGVLFGGVGTMMLIFFIVKILELTHQELDQL